MTGEVREIARGVLSTEVLEDMEKPLQESSPAVRFDGDWLV